MLNKDILRKEMLEKRSLIPPEERQRKNKIIKDSLFNLEEYKRSEFIFTFISFKDEVDTHNIIKDSLKNKKRIGVPITVPKKKQLKVSEVLDFEEELEIGFYNILTPKDEHIRIIPKEKVDLVLVPGLVFDRRGYRIGYGGGYYDRFFSTLDDNVVKIGICYDMQVQKEEVPTDSYDIPVDYILTEKELIKCNNQEELADK